MNKLPLLIILAVLLIPLAGALTEEQFTQLKQLENQQVPSLAQKLLAANERINIKIDNEQIAIIIENYKISSVNKGKLEDNTIDIITSQAAIDKLSASKDPKTTLKDLLKSKELIIKPKGTFKKIKFGLAKFILKFF